MLSVIIRMFLVMFVLQTAFYEVRADDHMMMEDDGVGQTILSIIKEGFEKMVEKIMELLKAEKEKTTTPAPVTVEPTTPVSTTETPKAKHCLDERGIFWEGKCFWAALRTRNREFTYSKGVGLCRKDGGSPANIYNDEHFKLTMHYLRSKIPAGHTAFKFAVWTGMTFDVTAKQLSFNNGDPASFVSWYPDPKAPYTTPGTEGWTQIGTDVDKDASDSQQGMLNSSPYWNKHAIYCQKNYP